MESRVEAIIQYPKPTLIKDLLQFLRMLNFYRPCIKDAAESELCFSYTWLNFISQFSTDIQHFEGCSNVADALSHLEELSIDEYWNQLAAAQENNQELKKLCTQENLSFKKFYLPCTKYPVWCKTSKDQVRPYIPCCLPTLESHLSHHFTS